MKRKIGTGITRIICFALILSMLSQSGMPTVTASAGNVTQTVAELEATLATDEEIALYTEEITGQETITISSGDAGEDAEPEILHEIEENRGEFSKEYLLSDNSRTLVVYPQQIHYETADGKLSEIDNSLLKTEDGYVNGSNSYELLITDNEDSWGEVIYREEEYEISWQMVELVSEETQQESQETVSTGDGAAVTATEVSGETDREAAAETDISSGDVSIGDVSSGEAQALSQETLQKEKNQPEGEKPAKKEKQPENKVSSDSKNTFW